MCLINASLNMNYRLSCGSDKERPPRRRSVERPKNNLSSPGGRLGLYRRALRWQRGHLLFDELTELVIVEVPLRETAVDKEAGRAIQIGRASCRETAQICV